MNLKDVVIRRVTDKDIKLLESFLSSGDFIKHRERLKAQQDGIAEYLIAWHVIPIGHVFIIWTGGNDGPLQGIEDKGPLIEDIYIHPAARRKGIGKMLMGEAERLIQLKGYNSVGLTVATNNPLVEAIHKKRGYRETDLGVFKSHRIFTNKKGRKKEWSSKVKYLVKDL
jgi:GNAT superfamily N-acetyltransferase